MSFERPRSSSLSTGHRRIHAGLCDGADFS